MDERNLSNLKQDEECSFDFILPEAPYSFKGQLFSIEWALELVIIPFGNKKQLGIVVSPTAVAIAARNIKEAKSNRDESQFINIKIKSPDNPDSAEIES